MNNLKLSPTWITYLNQVEALFGDDPDIEIEYDNDNYEITLYVNAFKGIKAEAIRRLLPETVDMGNITLTINVIPADTEATQADIVAAAFYGNPHFAGIVNESHGILGTVTFGLFKNETVQYFNDDLTKYCGNDTVILADVAKALLNNDADDSFYFSTDVK